MRVRQVNDDYSYFITKISFGYYAYANGNYISVRRFSAVKTAILINFRLWRLNSRLS